MRFKGGPEGPMFILVGSMMIGAVVLAIVESGTSWWILLLPPPCPFGIATVFGAMMFCQAWERGKR
jgi:hypothetical protein